MQANYIISNCLMFMSFMSCHSIQDIIEVDIIFKCLLGLELNLL